MLLINSQNMNDITNTDETCEWIKITNWCRRAIQCYVLMQGNNLAFRWGKWKMSAMIKSRTDRLAGSHCTVLKYGVKKVVRLTGSTQSHTSVSQQSLELLVYCLWHPKNSYKACCRYNQSTSVTGVLWGQNSSTE